MESVKRRAGRPRTNVLSRDLIMQTSLRLITERGEAGASMRDISRELGVQPSALYNHVTGYEEVIGGVRELVSARIDTSGFGTEPWDVALERWARSYRLAFAAHPPTIALLAVKPLAEYSRVSAMYDTVCAGLTDAGWPQERVLSVVVALECFILGAALDRAAPSDVLGPGANASTPHFLTAYEGRAAALGAASPADAAFEIGLELMLTGLRAEHAAIAPSSDPSQSMRQ